MRTRIILGCVIALGVAASTADAPASTQVRTTTTLNTRLPRIYFQTEPNAVVVPNTRVYYYQAPEYDVYRLGRYWYVNQDGTWYRSNSYRGPFVTTSYASVPRVIIGLPAQYHRHPVRHDRGKHRGWTK